MSLTSVNNAPSSCLATSTSSTRAERSETVAAGLGTTLVGLATAASDGVSATVSFSGKALHALEQAGEATVDAVVHGGSSLASAASSAVDEVEDVAIGAWHAVQHAAHAVEHAGEAIADAIGDGVQEIVSTAKSVGSELGHYAQVGLSATGEALSEVASGSVLTAAAVGKSLSALI